jgi:hypothetical protein
MYAILQIILIFWRRKPFSNMNVKILGLALSDKLEIPDWMLASVIAVRSPNGVHDVI